MKNRFKLIVALLFFAPFFAVAANLCESLFILPSATAQLFQTMGAATFDVNYGGKEVTSVLVNAKNYENLKPMFEKTFGIVVTHQKGYRNDHGLMRVGTYHVDRDTPGYRNRGEINQTGIAWIPIEAYLNYTFKNPGAYNRIEVMFDLSKNELDTVTAYEKMRRAATIRPNFTFGGNKNPEGNNRLANGGEICFSFSCGTSAAAHAEESLTKILEMGITQPLEFFELSVVKSYLNKVKFKFIHADLVKELYPQVTTEGDLATELVPYLPKLSESDTQILLNWIVGYSLSKEYSELIKTLGIYNSSDYSNIRSPRATAILVYDPNISDQDFMSENYKSQGVFSTWSHLPR